MRLPYVSDPPPTSSPEEEAIVQRTRERRHPRPLQKLDLALLHSPAIIDGWNSFIGSIRTRTSIADDIRELAITRIAYCNKAWYEWDHHAPLAVAGGLDVKALEVLKQDIPEAKPEVLTDPQWAVLLYTDEMTRNVEVKDETFALLRSHFTEKEIVEITATVGGYNCVSRFLVALDVAERNGTGPGDLSIPHH